jgi:chemotaxis protein MotA
LNPSTLIGIVGSFSLLALVLFTNTADPRLFLDLPSLLLVVGGTLAATFLSYPLKEVFRIFGLIGTVLRNERLYAQTDLEELVRVAKIWMQDNPLLVERELAKINNPFLRTGVQMVIDRAPEEDILDLLQWRISRLRARESAEAELFRVMANYAPAFGMIGTLVGLVSMMDVLGSGDMSLIGPQLAVALITTFYGILLANLVFKPVAVKLERRTEQRVVLMNMIMQGVAMMSAKRSPSMMRETLKSFVAEYENELSDRTGPTHQEGAKP